MKPPLPPPSPASSVAPPVSRSKAWPEPGHPQPSVDDVLAPLAAVLASFKITRRPGVMPGHYNGLPITLDTCDDPNQLFEAEHLKIREDKGLPFADPLTLALRVAFELGAEHRQRSMRQRSTGGASPAAGPRRRERKAPGPTRYW